MALQPDGKMLISGGFSAVAGQLRNGFARLHADGTIDTAFSPTLDLRSRVTDMLPLVDGKILVSYSGTIPGITDPGTKVLRFNADGSWDSAFQLIAPAAFQLLVQPDGKIVVAAFSSAIDPTQNVRRYHPDGSPDATFALATNGPVRTLAMLADVLLELPPTPTVVPPPPVPTSTPPPTTARAVRARDSWTGSTSQSTSRQVAGSRSASTARTGPGG